LHIEHCYHFASYIKCHSALIPILTLITLQNEIGEIPFIVKIAKLNGKRKRGNKWPRPKKNKLDFHPFPSYAAFAAKKKNKKKYSSISEGRSLALYLDLLQE
jgi:hypothetical protein